MRRLVAVLMAGAFLLASGVALAQGAGYVKKKVFEFGGDDIEGSLLSPSGEFLSGGDKIVFDTLIEYRYDFIPEMIKSAEDL